MKKYSTLYIIALTLIALLLVLSYLIMNYAIDRQSYDASIINISGKQRMLSQRTALLAAQLIYPEKREWAKSELEIAANTMHRAHMGLTRGDEELKLPGVRSEEIKRLYFEKRIPHEEEDHESHDHYDTKDMISLDNLVLHYIEEIRSVLKLTDDELVPHNPLLSHTINDYHDLILPFLDEVVTRYEQESLERIRELKEKETMILIIMLSVLFIEALIIFRPMIREIIAYTQELEYKNKQLKLQKYQEKLAALGQLSGGLAHEINNALQPILGLSEILKIRIKDEEAKKYLTILENSTLHARKVLQNLLSFAHDTKANAVLIDAQDSCNDLISFIRSSLPETVKLEIQTGFPQNLKHGVYGDKTAMTLVIMQILKNAQDAMNDSGTLLIGGEQRDLTDDELKKYGLKKSEYIILNITDNGCGMDKNTAEQIFNPFFSTKDDYQKTGLGMSTAFGIMKQMGGSISVKSEAGTGTTVCLYFPVTVKMDKSA